MNLLTDEQVLKIRSIGARKGLVRSRKTSTTSKLAVKRPQTEKVFVFQPHKCSKTAEERTEALARIKSWRKEQDICVKCARFPSAGEHTTYCKACTEENNKRMNKNRLANPKKWIFDYARKNARVGKHSFRLKSPDQIPDIPERCPILPHIKLRWAPGEGHRPDSPSIDRIDSMIGYEIGNIHITSYRANILKRDATLDELILLGRWAQKQKKTQPSDLLDASNATP